MVREISIDGSIRMEEPCPQVVHRAADKRIGAMRDASPRSFDNLDPSISCSVRLAEPIEQSAQSVILRPADRNPFARMKIRRPKDL
jgi:hypothetical protein